MTKSSRWKTNKGWINVFLTREELNDEKGKIMLIVNTKTVAEEEIAYFPHWRKDVKGLLNDFGIVLRAKDLKGMFEDLKPLEENKTF